MTWLGALKSDLLIHVLSHLGRNEGLNAALSCCRILCAHTELGLLWSTQAERWLCLPHIICNVEQLVAGLERMCQRFGCDRVTHEGACDVAEPPPVRWIVQIPWALVGEVCDGRQIVSEVKRLGMTLKMTGQPESVDSFEDMHLKDDLLRGVYAYGYERPSTVQRLSIVPLTRRFDAIVQSDASTGKTSTYVVGALQRVSNGPQCQVLVLVPARCLAGGVSRVFMGIAKYMPGTRILTCGGEAPIWEDPQIVVGTPGAVLAMMNRLSFTSPPLWDLRELKMLVLDELDEMLSCGFKDQIHEILAYMHPGTQTAVFSSTTPAEVLAISEASMDLPLRILVKRNELTLEGIKQFYVAVDREEWKLDTLCDLFEGIPNKQAIFFCNTPRKVDWLMEKLHSREGDFELAFEECGGSHFAALHGDMDHREREVAMKEFSSGAARVLITDLLTRGIDLQQGCCNQLHYERGCAWPT